MLALQKYREYVATRRDAVSAMWKKPPPPVMLAYGAVILTSGVLFSALGHWNKLKGFMWGSGLSSVLTLALEAGSVSVPIEGKTKIGDVLAAAGGRIGLPETTKEEFGSLFLESVQWELIYAVNGELSEAMRDQLSLVLQIEGTEDDRARAVHEFLQQVDINAFKSKLYVDVAVGRAVAGVVPVFEGRGYKLADLVTGMLA